MTLLDAQRKHLDSLSLKYFDDYSDDELVTYDQIQKALMVENEAARRKYAQDQE